MDPFQLRIWFTATIVTAALNLCFPAIAGVREDAINRRMRVQIRSDIKAHGQTFSGPEVVPPALLKVIEGKRLVGLGEGTHGTSEIQTLHGNIILTVAKRARVLVFLEDQFGSVAPINQFAQGVGDDTDLPKAMVGLYGVHKTLEFETFFRAVRAFNATAPTGTKVEIYGVDDIVFAGPADVTPALQTFSIVNNLKLDTEIATCASYINDLNAHLSEARATFAGAAMRIQLAISRVELSVAGQVEAAVMANDLVRFIQQEEASSCVFSGVVLNEAKDGPSNTIINGARDAGMAENIKILMDGKIQTSGIGIFWGHNAHVGRISYLDGDPTGFPSTWGNTGTILHTWLGDAYAPLATMTGAGTFRAHYMDTNGNVSPFQPVTAPTIYPDCLNAIATNAFHNRPVFFKTTEVSLLGFTRFEFAVAGLYLALHPDHCFIRTVPGMAYAGVISFPKSTAAHEMNR